MPSRALVLSALAALAVGLSAVSPVAAQERRSLDLSTALAAAPTASMSAPVVDLAETMGSTRRRTMPSPLMNTLYVSTAAVQALDVHSTLLALRRGAVEANPLMTGATRHQAAFVALKAGIAISSVMAARNMSKRNKVAAVATLVAINSAYAMVIRHNYRVASRLR